MGGQLIINGKLSNCLTAIYGGDSLFSSALAGSGVQVWPAAYVYDTHYCVTNKYRTFVHSQVITGKSLRTTIECFLEETRSSAAC